jgi:hypothetical protein
LPQLATRAAVVILRTSLWIPLALLPVAAAYGMRTQGPLIPLVVPFSVFSLLAMWIVAFVFCNQLPNMPAPVAYLASSYARLAMVPCFVALIYVLQTAGQYAGKAAAG